MLTTYSLMLVACLNGAPACDEPMREALVVCAGSNNRDRCLTEHAIAPGVTILRGRGPDRVGSEITPNGVTILRGGR